MGAGLGAGLGAGQGAGNRSLADEILDELYGSTGRGPGAASPEYSAIAEAGAGPHDKRGHGEGAGVGGERSAGESRRYLQGVRNFDIDTATQYSEA